MGRAAAFLYGVIAYLIFFVTFLYAIGFVGNFLVPESIDSGGGEFSISSIVIDAVLLGIFALQHSIMARQWFKRRWSKLVPQPIERSTYVLLASLCLIVLFWQWRPMTGAIWSVASATGRPILWALFWLGWLTVLASTFMIDHFELFGLRQVWDAARGREPPAPVFRTPILYRAVRHPLYLGFLVAFWSTPTMSVGHLVFASGMTAYVLIGMRFEERDLVRTFGHEYRAYQQRVPALLPTRAPR
jgi:protein-S-isoprenylcysteine O-methyltransferase Ste14